MLREVVNVSAKLVVSSSWVGIWNGRCSFRKYCGMEVGADFIGRLFSAEPHVR
jgi:hypothetical protein